MKAKEVIRRIIDHNRPPRFGYQFTDPAYNDFVSVSSRLYCDEKPNPYESWGRHEALLNLASFTGEVCQDRFGNIYGRFGGRTKGECIRGAIRTWDDFDRYTMPRIDRTYRERLLAMNLAQHDNYVLASGCSIFSDLRDARLMANALADTVLEPDRVEQFLDRVVSHNCDVIENIAGCGLDAMFIGDDWGTQDRTFISPEAFRTLFKPAYRRLTDALHAAGMKCVMHSCGYIYRFIADLIDAGIDVFQFDQPDIYPTEVLAREFGNQVSFLLSVDIQKILPTGDRDLIVRRTREMLDAFRENCGGSLIIKDYGAWDDIGVRAEWAAWARDTVLQNSALRGDPA
jgi:uroporphyrinogen decarboxylase